LDWTNSQVKKRCSPAACAKSTSALKQWILWTKPLGWFCVNQFADFTNHLYKRLKSAHHIPRNWQRQPGDTLSFATFMELAAGHCILCNIHGIGGRTLLFFICSRYTVQCPTAKNLSVLQRRKYTSVFHNQFHERAVFHS
jgi:hypothetical protein